MAKSRIFCSLRCVCALILAQYLLVSPSLAQTQDDKDYVVVDGYRTIEWTDLMPKEDLDAILDPPEYLDEIADGSPEDQIKPGQISSDSGQGISDEITGNLSLEELETNVKARRYEEALLSTRVVPAFDGQAIRLPGFIVPLEFGEDQQQVTKFFLVPYFGACIHVPPPPPNQIIYAEYEKGFTLESLYQPYWLSGTLSTTLIENDTATAAYTIKADQLEAYTE